MVESAEWTAKGTTKIAFSKKKIPVFKVQSLTGHYQTKCFTSKNRKKWKREFLVGWRILSNARREEKERQT